MKKFLPSLSTVRHAAFATALVLAATGCAMFNHFDYRTTIVTPPRPQGPSTVAVAVVDRRSDVLGKTLGADYVGMTRNGFGIPFHVTTKSGAALASDLTTALVDGLRQSGWTATAVTADSQGDVDASLAKLRQTHASRQILVRLYQWESDTLIHTELNVDVTLVVCDARGHTLATTHYAGSQQLGGSATPEMHARECVLSETGRILSKLLHAPGVAAVL